MAKISVAPGAATTATVYFGQLDQLLGQLTGKVSFKVDKGYRQDHAGQ